jgi:hypothetical protein
MPAICFISVTRCPHHPPLTLQGVLGELSYESDAAERLRSELRAASAEAGRLRAQLDADAARLAAAEQVPLWRLLEPPHSGLGHRHSIHLTGTDCFQSHEGPKL